MTVKTLAGALGVSPSTISNAYNRPDQLSAHLRERILAKATELGYAGPDAAGRTLRVGRADAVGVLLGERLSFAFSDPFYIEFLTGVSQVAEQHDISIVLMPLAQEADNGALTSIRQASIDAMAVLCVPVDHPAIAVARIRAIRLVTTDADPDPTTAWVAIDEERAGFLIGTHLTALGHRDVTVVLDSNRPPGTEPVVITAEDVHLPHSRARLTGLRRAISGTVTLVSTGHNSIPSGHSAGRWLTQAGDPPTAIVALSDVLALGVLDALEEGGFVTPADISVCGFDDVPAAAAADLTTIRQPILERGREIGRLLLDAESQPRQVMLPVQLVVRATTGRARG
ncbi:MAG TPA: LacI family DNA-binding transcriptional regulator [Propionibacteriaceae bacterium]